MQFWELCSKEDCVTFHGRSMKQYEEAVNHIKEWFQLQKHLPIIPPDYLIEKFLVLNKINVEKTKSRLDYYYSIRSLVPEIYNYANPTKSPLTEIADYVYWVPLPKLTKDLNRVTIGKMRNPDVENFSMGLFFAFVLSVVELRLLEELSISNHIVIDLEGGTLGHLGKVNVVLLKKIVTICTKVYTSSAKGLHFVNCPPIVDKFFKILNRVMPEKLHQRMQVHTDVQSLHNVIDKSILPIDYGGEEKSLEELHGIIKEKLKEYKGHFDHLDTLKVDESKRIGKSIVDPELFGTEGYFKKLDID